MRAVRLTLLGLALAGGVSADTEKITVRSVPPCRVYALGDDLDGPGRPSWTPIEVQFVEGRAPLSFRRPGYRPRDLTVLLEDVAQEKVYPVGGVLVLWPESLRSLLADLFHQNVLLSLGGLFLAGSGVLAVGLHWQRRRRRQAIYQRYSERRDHHDSLCMQTVGKYLLAERLGSGGMATVYRGLPRPDLREADAVAVKVLSREAMANQEFRERFRREVNAYRKLQHPNVVRLDDWGEVDGGMIYMVLELVQGETVRQQLERGPVPARPILESLSRALTYAHEQGIIHRDLKPENLMLTRSGQLKVMDFGLALDVSAAKLTQSGTMMGTPAYMAPEQLNLQSATPRLDQYAFGVIAYELLTGSLPYRDLDTLVGLMTAILHNPHVPLRQRDGRFSASLEAVLDRMLAKVPADRFESIQAAWSALERELPP